MTWAHYCLILDTFCHVTWAPNTFSIAIPHAQQYVEHVWTQLLSVPLVAPTSYHGLGHVMME